MTMTKHTTDFRDFFDAYIKCALWSSTDNAGKPMDANYSRDDVAFGSLLSMARDCRHFMRDNSDDLSTYCVEMSGDWRGMQRAGHDFWLTRNRHGAGFWDRGLGDLGRRLTDAAHAWGSSDLYIGDDGKIYAS